MQKREATCHEELIDPDPVSLLLTVLGAVGSIASVYALFQARKDPHRAHRQVQGVYIRDALMGAETALNEIRAHVRSLQIAFEAGTSGRVRSSKARQQVARFGKVGLLFTADGHHTWRELEAQSLGTVARVHKHMSDVLRLCASSSLVMPEGLAHQLESVVGELNTLLQRFAEITFEQLFPALEEVAGSAMNFIRELRIRLDEMTE
jgi:hypothetical protein